MLSPSALTAWPATSPNPTLMLIVTLSEKAAPKNCATAFTVETNPVGALFTLESKLTLTIIGAAPAPRLAGGGAGVAPHQMRACHARSGHRMPVPGVLPACTES